MTCGQGLLIGPWASWFGPGQELRDSSIDNSEYGQGPLHFPIQFPRSRFVYIWPSAWSSSFITSKLEQTQHALIIRSHTHHAPKSPLPNKSITNFAKTTCSLHTAVHAQSGHSSLRSSGTYAAQACHLGLLLRGSPQVQLLKWIRVVGQNQLPRCEYCLEVTPAVVLALLVVAPASNEVANDGEDN
jgi:hypothetical protein